MNNTSKKKIGLALGGGATRAFSIFAIFTKIKKAGVSVSCVSGSSAGAIIAAYYALFGEVESLKKELESFSYKDWFKFADFTLGHTKSLIKANEFRKYLRKKFGDKTFADLKIPLVVTATNLDSGKLHYITQGDVVDAIVASSAYPGIFPPCEIEGILFVDGGVLNNLPYEILFKKGADRVIAINLGTIESGGNNFKTSISVVSRSLELMMDNAFNQIYDEDESLFVFDVKFKRGFSSTWNISDLGKKYKAGENEFKRRRVDFLNWCDIKKSTRPE